MHCESLNFGDCILVNSTVALQRQMGYMIPSQGSFSMFRDYQEPTPSVWSVFIQYYIKALIRNQSNAKRHMVYPKIELKLILVFALAYLYLNHEWVYNYVSIFIHPRG